jgi:hypothetical protein
VRFDDPNLVSCAGLAPIIALTERCELRTMLIKHVKIAAKGGANAATKILSIVVGMVCGADTITDLDLLPHGGMDRLFDGVRAPSTLGTYLRLFTFGHVRQLDAVAAGLLTRLAACTPVLPRSCPAPTNWCSSMLMTRRARPTATPSRAPDAVTPA